MSEDRYQLSDLLSQAIRRIPGGSSTAWALGDIYRVDDLEVLTDNIAHSSLRTTDPEMRRYLEAKICLLARASAGGADGAIVDGQIKLHDAIKYFLANLHFGEIVLEYGKMAFVAIKPGEL